MASAQMEWAFAAAVSGRVRIVLASTFWLTLPPMTLSEPARASVTMSQCVARLWGSAMLSYAAPLLAREAQTRSPTCGATSVTR